jgi:rubrerythrin
VAGPNTDNLGRRQELVELLARAAQIEHDVLCQYLFAAFTMKQRHEEGGVTYEQLELMRRWKGVLMEVARQEMEHLGIVTNLLIAIGEAPRLERPDFPVPKSIFPIDSQLVPFSAEALLRFVCFEMPGEVPPEEAEYLEARIPDFHPGHFDAIFLLYERVKTLVTTVDPGDLFIGPFKSEFLTGGNAVAVRGRSLPNNEAAPQIVYGISIPVITDAASAAAAIDQIVEEGEGAGGHLETSHFARFLDMYKGLERMQAADPDFEPARPVVSNPRTSPRRGNTRITNKATIRVSELFDRSYALLIELLMRMFASSDETREDVATLESIAFFPMMTTVIRPLAEILTELPAFVSTRPERAGPTFVLPDDVPLLPHRRAAWLNLDMQLAFLEELALGVAEDDVYPEAVRLRLGHVMEQLAVIRSRFERAMVVQVPT